MEQTEQPTKNKRGIVISIIAIVVVIAIAVFAIPKKAATPTPTDSSADVGCKPGYLFSETTGNPCPQAAANETPVGAPSAYEAALKDYAGKLVAFDGACKQVSGISSSIPAGTRILVANNSDKTIKLSVDGKSETLDGYHYFTTTIKAKGAVKVSCENKDAATINVQ